MNAPAGRHARAPNQAGPASALTAVQWTSKRAAWRGLPAATTAHRSTARRACWRAVKAAAGPTPGNAPALSDGPALQQQQQAPGNTSSSTTTTSSSSSNGGGGPRPQGSNSGGDSSSALSLSALRRLVRPLANLQLAIAELAGIAALSALGTVIPQNKPYEFYAANYPDVGDKVLGFVTSRLIWALQWDHIYTADYFLLLIALWAASLAACTWTNQWPAVRVAQRWRFRSDPDLIAKQEVAEVLPNARVEDVGRALAGKQYQVFLRDGSLYAFKGLAGKMGPIGVHASMLLALAGICAGLLGGFKGSAMVPEGGDLLLAQALEANSPVAQYPSGASVVLHVDDFRIDYRSDGSIRQFYSDVTLRDLEGREVASRTMSVNQPLRYGGVTAYQTDWSMSALTVKAVGSPLQPSDGTPFKLPMARLAGKAGDESKLFATFIPAANPSQGGKPIGVSVLAKDLQSVVLYDSKGEFVGVRRPGSGKSIMIDGMEITIERIVAGTGFELKHDPGVPLTYAGFGGMCLTTVVSYLSHSQVWATQQAGGSVVVGGRSNRAKFGFQQELQEVIDAVPEVLPAAPALK